jgi:membrane protein DedA with SNARE-associated domain
MFIENVLPPIPSEVIMPWAGFRSAQGELSLAGVVIAGTAGSLAGSTFWYLVARRLGPERLERWVAKYGRWIGLYPEDVRKGRDIFAKRGAVIVCIGRLLPGIRTLVSIPAGFAGMPAATFLAWSAIGTFAWTCALAVAGRALGRNYGTLGDTIGPLATALVAGLILLMVARAVRRRGEVSA